MTSLKKVFKECATTGVVLVASGVSLLNGEVTAATLCAITAAFLMTETAQMIDNYKNDRALMRNVLAGQSMGPA